VAWRVNEARRLLRERLGTMAPPKGAAKTRGPAR
jgi:hypothetical protein